jgi:Carbohydrate family 9 binding domain-like
MNHFPADTVLPIPRDWQHTSVKDWNWSSVPALSAFILVDGSSPATQQTQVRLVYSSEALYVRFDCADDDIWGTYTKRDDPLYDEEVVEVFIAAGTEIPSRYFEFEVSPYGVLFDCTIYNPSGLPGEHFVVDETWNAEGLEWYAVASPETQRWWAILVIPWRDMGGFSHVWRANFYRIERSRCSGTELSCWSATFAEGFHVPARFGLLRLELDDTNVSGLGSVPPLT